MKIEIRKPQYLAGKDPVSGASKPLGKKKTPFFFRLLLIATYVLSALAIWYVYQKFSVRS